MPSKIEPTDDKLKADAGSLCSQYLHFWDKGEVEVTVILGRPGAQRVVYATSITSRDRLLHCLDSVKGESVLQSMLVNKHRLTR
jgi:hypothetical protein